MGKKIDISAASKAKLTSQGNDSDLAYLKANGARALPASPTAAGWSAEAIKKQLYKQPEILFAWIKAIGDALETLGINIDDYLDASDKLVVHLAGDETITGKKTFTDNVKFGSSESDNSKTFDVYYTINLRGPVTSAPIFPGNLGFSLGASDNRWNTAYVQYLDVSQTIKQGSYAFSLPSKSGTFALVSDVESYHRFRTDASGYIYQIFADGEDEENSDNRVMNHNDGVALANEVKLLKEAVAAIIGIKTYEQGLIEKIMQGTLTAGYASRADRASHDGEGNLIDVTQYVKTIATSYDQTTGLVTLTMKNAQGGTIGTAALDITAETHLKQPTLDEDTNEFVFQTDSGTEMRVALSRFIDTYVSGLDPDGICEVSVANHQIIVSVKDGSISMAKLSSTLQSTWNGWVSAEADRVLAEQGRVAAEAQRVLNENARLAMPHLDIDGQGYLIINYGSGRDITID